MSFDLGNGNVENKLKVLAGIVKDALESAGGGAAMPAGYVGKYTLKGVDQNPFQTLANGEMIYTDENITASGTLFLSMTSNDGLDNRTVFLGGVYGSPDVAVILLSPVGKEGDQYKITRVRATGSQRNDVDKVGFYLDASYGNSQEGEIIAGQEYNVYLLMKNG